MNKIEWLEKHGFDENEVTYCVWGDDTFSIKDWLKEKGAKYNPFLKWHTGNMFDLPVGYRYISFNFNEIYEWDEECGEACFKEKAKEIIERRFAEAAGPSLSEYVGEIGERLRNITAVYKSTRGFNGNYGYTYIHTFESQNNVLVWFTQKELFLEKGQVIDLTGTVKKHEEFRGVKTTQLSRCIIKEI